VHRTKKRFHPKKAPHHGERQPSISFCGFGALVLYSRTHTHKMDDTDDGDDDDDVVQEEKVFLYDSWKRQVCGCRESVRRFAALLLESQQQQNNSTSGLCCPKCHHVVKYIVDEAATDDSSTSSSTVIFKYGKQIYQLTVLMAQQSQQQPSQQQSQQQQPAAPLDASFWTTRNLLSCTGMTTTTAQGRIAQVLRLNIHTMKVRS
jgi:hypothetical protein